MFFKNKHVIASLIIAPILAIISYFAVDYYVAEAPHKAKQGQLYKMLAKPNCRWESGICELVNGELEIVIISQTQTYGLNQLLLRSSTALKDIKFALVEKKNKVSKPRSMLASDDKNTAWHSPQINISKSDYLQFVISVNESVFYAEIPAIFIYKEALLEYRN